MSGCPWCQNSRVKSLASGRSHRVGRVRMSCFGSGHGMEWKTIFPYSIPKIFHSIFHSILKFPSIFHSILKFSSIFHSILPYQRNFRLEAMQPIFCCFSPLQATAHEGAPTILRCNDWYLVCILLMV